MNLNIWSGLLLTGKSISREQAAKVIIQTTDLRAMRMKDSHWGLEVFREFGIPLENLEDVSDPKWDPLFEESKKRYNLLTDPLGYSRLEFFSNWKISSCSFRGPHGWVSWEGEVFANNYDIGKYPYLEGILEEWELIASHFPFLDLRLNLLSDSICERESVPVYELIVKEGEVNLNNIFRKPVGNPMNYFPIHRQEKGVNLDYLRWALSCCQE